MCHVRALAVLLLVALAAPAALAARVGILSNKYATETAADFNARIPGHSFTGVDTGSALECQQPIPARISPKDTRNACTFFEPRTTVERETKSAPPASARKAFDDLFK